MESPFEFQSDSFGTYGEDLLNDNIFDFGSTQWEEYGFGVAPVPDQDIPTLSPDASSKDNDNSPESHVVSPAVSLASRSQKSHARFSKKARSVLRTWFISHRDNPYPTPDEKVLLEIQTGLEKHQVALWLANARRRNKPRVQNFLPTLSDDLPEIPETQAIPQTQAISQTPEQMMAMLPPPLPMVDTDEKAELVFSTLKPFDRWKIDYRWSQEPAEVLHITDAMLRSPQRAAENVEALAHNDAPTEYAPSNILEFGTNASSSEFDTFWAQSMASYSTGLTGVASTSYLSDHTAFSYQPSSAGFLDTKSLNSFDDIKPRRRCNAKRAIKERSQGGKFQCTFCNNRTFKTKHDWQRHEKSQHLNIESWACCAFGGTIETAQGPICAFCNHPYPSVEHLETHHFSACQSKGLSERTFYRKDHFVQHLHLVHECGMNSCMDIWRVELDIISRCGFCNMQLTSWKNRADHLAAHFKTGSKMSDWRGDLGFEEHINAIIDFGTDFDPKRFDPDFCWTTSSRATQVSSLDYQGDAGNDLSKQLLNAPLSRVSSTQLSATPQNGDSLYGGLVSEPGITMGERTVGQARLYDIFECVAGTPCDS